MPRPLPCTITVSANEPGGASKVALIATSALRTTVQGAVPLQPPPLQPANTKLGAGVAVRVTAVPPG